MLMDALSRVGCGELTALVHPLEPEVLEAFAGHRTLRAHGHMHSRAHM